MEIYRNLISLFNCHFSIKVCALCLLFIYFCFPLSLIASALYFPLMNDLIFIVLFSLTHVLFLSNPFLFSSPLFSTQVCLCARVLALPHVRLFRMSVSGTPLIHNRRVFCPLPVGLSSEQGSKTRQERTRDYLSLCEVAGQELRN